MTLNEILHTPYQLLLMMQMDKIRVKYESDNKNGNDTEVEGKELMQYFRNSQ